MKYLVIGHVGASVSQVVEADTPEEAIDEGELHASICHHCARSLSIGDVDDIEVIEDEGAGDVVYSDVRDREDSRDARTSKAIADWIRKRRRGRVETSETLAEAIERGDWRKK